MSGSSDTSGSPYKVPPLAANTSRPDPAPPVSKNPAVKAPNRQRIAEVEATNEERIGQLQTEIKALDQQINGKAAGADRDALIAQKGALMSALQLTQEFQDYVGKASRSPSAGS